MNDEDRLPGALRRVKADGETARTFLTYQVSLGTRHLPLRLPDPGTILNVSGDQPPEPGTVAYAAKYQDPDEVDGQGWVEFLGLDLPPQTDRTGWFSPRGDILLASTAHVHLRIAFGLFLSGVIPVKEFWPTGIEGLIDDYTGKDWAIKQRMFDYGWIRWFGKRLYGYAETGVGFELVGEHLGDLQTVLGLMDLSTPVTVTYHHRSTGEHRVEGTVRDLFGGPLDLGSG